MTLKEFQKIVKFAKKSGILKLKFDSVELEFSYDALSTIQPKQLLKETEDTPQISNEDLMFWSTHDPLDQTGT